MYHIGTRGIVTKVTDLKGVITNENSATKLPETASSLSGGIFSDFDLAWTFSGAVLKIFSTADGMVQSSWDFSSVTRDNRTQIRCVIEYPVSDSSRLTSKENQICLIVSYTSKKDSNKNSYISFCHPRTSRILHTITTKEKVTCLSLVAPRKDHANPLSGIIKLMSGALAIGTHSGNLLVLDIKDIFSCCRRNSFDPMRNRFSEMVVLDLKRLNENEIKDRISKLGNQSNHIAVSLSDKKDSRDPDVEICVITYIPESTCLAVGLKNGSFQLWDVNTMKKLYKSSSLEIHTPVVGFGFQEPCNDPQNFCYLWVLHESESKNPSCLPFAVMYGILYKKVTSIPTYGRHYKNFIHCKKRFDLDVDLERCVSGRCITSSVVSNTPSNILRHVSTHEDASKINLFVMIFETWERNADVNSTISMIVFDMNQWYKAQMPHQCYLGYAVPFVNFMLLERVSERRASILDMRIKKDTIQQFLSFNLSEEYTFPSSLSFDTLFLTDSKIINVRIPGAQRSVLERIVSEGPIGLVNPSKYYTECKEAGLRPCFLDTFSNVIVPSQVQQRNYVLTILLENKISSFLVRCVKEWADGSRGVSGCILPNLIQWAWECITRIKQTTDVICIPLFDYSGDDLDRENYQKLKHCVQLIHVIRDLLVYIYKNYKHFLLDDVKLKHQVDTLQLVTKYFDVIIWCLDCNLLPEKVPGSSDKCVPIYIMNILQYTEQRREELKRNGLNDKYFLIVNATPLIVDAVLETDPKGNRLQMQWQRESGGITSGLYPPVTLQSLLRMFLLPDLSTDVKHFIMLYFLLDVCDYHRDEEMKEQLLSFSVIFSVDTAYFSLVQACWFLDHEKFEEAIDILTVDAVITQLRQQPPFYKTIMQACVCQKQYGVALKLERLVKLSAVVFPDDRFYITLLLQNGLVMEAYTTLKKVSFGQKELLRHFFKVCDDFGLLKEIFKFPISMAEENEFMSYLDEYPNRDAGDLKIMYLLSRGRYVEAVDVNHNLASVVPKFDVVGRETTKQNTQAGRTTTRDLLVGAFSKTLPGVTNELLTFCRKEKDKIYRFKEVTKPTPLSVVVHTDTTQQIPTYKSSFESVLHAAISKTAETWSSFPKLVKKKTFNMSMVKETPFLRSDIMTPRKDVSLLYSREKTYADLTKLDVYEPPTKRMKSIPSPTFDFNPETNESELLKSPGVEVTKILTTPHVQKRLNKLLQSTPESSPLTSILKNSEVSRFKQPQKVGFNMPENRRSASRKVAVIAETSPSSALKSCAATNAVKKVIADQFSPSVQTRADVIVENVAVTQQGKVSSPPSELDNSINADSYYSLESDNEMNDFVVDEPLVKQSATTQTNVVSRHQTFIESMSEDEVLAESSNRVIMEVMSEEESAAESQARKIIVDVHVEPTPTKPRPALSVMRKSLLTAEQSIIEESTQPVPNLISTQISREISESSPTSVACQSSEHIEVTNVATQLPSTSFVGNQEVNEISAPASQFHFQISNSFSVSSENKQISTHLEPDECISLATMQPISAESADERQKSQSETRPSWDSIYNDYRPTNTYSNQSNEVDSEEEEEDEEVEGTNVFGEERNAAFAGSSPVSCGESVSDEVPYGDSPRSRPNNSVTEIRDSSGENDSDIEILEDESVPPLVREEERRMNDVTTDENDDMSERSYESDYSYSQDSVDVVSQQEENSIVDEEENVDDEPDDEFGEESESDDEAEYEGDEEGEEDEAEVEAGNYGEEEREQEAQSVGEDAAVANENIGTPSTTVFDPEELCRENPSINFEELKKIVSNVVAIEATSEAISNPIVEAVKKYDISVASSPLNRSENEFSVCEIYNTTPSVIEETVNLDYSDVVVRGGEVSIADSTANVNTTVDEMVEESINESRKLDSSVEVLSLSSVTKEETSEPPMVFYFGENSVASIAEDMLVDDQENFKTSSIVNQSCQKPELTNSTASNVGDSNQQVEQNADADNTDQIADESVVEIKVKEVDSSRESSLQESIFIVDVQTDISVEEEMAKNRSLFNNSTVRKTEEEFMETAPAMMSTPVSKNACIRNSSLLEDSFSVESVCSIGYESQISNSSNSSVKTVVPRMSVITETTSLETSSKIASFASNCFPSHSQIIERTNSSALTQSDSSPTVTSPATTPQLSPIKQITSEVNPRSSPLIPVSTDKQALPPVNLELQLLAPAPCKSPPKPSDFAAVRLSSPGVQLIDIENQSAVTTDISSSCAASPSTSQLVYSLKESINETYRPALVQEPISLPRSSHPIGGQLLPPSKQITDETAHIQEHSLSQENSHLTVFKSSPSEQISDEVHHSTEGISNPLAACKSSPIEQTSDSPHQSMHIHESSSPCRSSSAAFTLPLREMDIDIDETSQFASIHETCKPQLDTSLTALKSSPCKPTTDDLQQLTSIKECSLPRTGSSSAVLRSSPSKRTTVETNLPARIEETSSPALSAPRASPSEPSQDESNKSVQALKNDSEHNTPETPLTSNIESQLFSVENQISPGPMKPIVPYSPTPEKSVTETIHRSAVCTIDRQSPKHQNLEETYICISSSSPPITCSKKIAAVVSPSISQQSSAHTPIGSSSPRSTKADTSQSSSMTGYSVQTPEKSVSSQSSVQVFTPSSRNSSVVDSPQIARGSSSPESFDGTYNSHVGLHPLRKDSAASNRISSPTSCVKATDITVLVQDEANTSIQIDAESRESVTLRPDVAPSPRRSVRLARRLSTDSITLEAVPENVSEAATISPARSTSRKLLQFGSKQLPGAGVVPVSRFDTDDGDNEDAASVKSEVSAVESVSSRASNHSQTRKRSSFTRLEMRKSSVRPNYRPLQVIVSDEELTSPTKSEVGAERQNLVVERKYAASEPGDVSSGSRRSKRSRATSATSEDDERASNVSEAGFKKGRSSKNKTDKNALNAAMLATPSPQKSKARKLVSSTPMKRGSEERVQTASAAAVTDYTMSRRLTRFQKTLLEGGIRRGQRDVGDEHIHGTIAVLDNVREETESLDFPKGNLQLSDDDDHNPNPDDDGELTTRAVKNRTIKTRASDVRASRRRRTSSSSASVAAAEPPLSSLSPSRREPHSADVSSDESVASRASTSSKRSKGRPSTFTKMELRRSSVRPHFKPLSVIPSDEENTSFQTPPRQPRSSHEDEALLSSSESTASRRSTARRSTSTGTGTTTATAVTARSRRRDSNLSEHETSSVSDVSNISVSTRRTRRSLAAEVANAATQPPNEISAKLAPVKKRFTKTQETAAEPSIKEIPKKRKRT